MKNNHKDLIERSSEESTKDSTEKNKRIKQLIQPKEW